MAVTQGLRSETILFGGINKDCSRLCLGCRALRHRSRSIHSENLYRVLHYISSTNLHNSIPHFARDWMGNRGNVVVWGDCWPVACHCRSIRFETSTSCKSTDAFSASSYGGMALCAMVFGAVGYFWAPIPRELHEVLPVELHRRFLAEWWAHSASYGSGFLGGVTRCVIVWVKRSRPRR
jgi:hypothetical protein